MAPASLTGEAAPEPLTGAAAVERADGGAVEVRWTDDGAPTRVAFAPVATVTHGRAGGRA
ncbi:hypothetical protein ACF1G0_17900 [Streptomyces sp. NPDC013953]|uniref:hypothetical protein n=1 Tax=Streptomyces sp. NPDC013953 TaxID=3364868 RepID=UPI0036FDBEBA